MRIIPYLFSRATIFSINYNRQHTRMDMNYRRTADRRRFTQMKTKRVPTQVGRALHSAL
jgi:hypothetical protein